MKECVMALMMCFALTGMPASQAWAEEGTLRLYGQAAPTIETEEASSAFRFDALTLDQGNAFIAISQNDGSGYNRWVPFYFHLSMDQAMSTEDVESYLKKYIQTASLDFGNTQGIFQSDELIWSAAEAGKGEYNLTLVLIPEVGELPLEGVGQIKTICLSGAAGKHSYDLTNYVIEERPTVPESEMYVSLCGIVSFVEEDRTARINYGLEVNENQICAFGIDYEFDDIVHYQIKKENTGNTYAVTVMLKEGTSKTVFRPFLYVEDESGQKRWLIPSVPVYFEEMQE